MNHAKTSFSTEIFAGAMISVVQYLAPLRYPIGYPACRGGRGRTTGGEGKEVMLEHRIGTSSTLQHETRAGQCVKRGMGSASSQRTGEAGTAWTEAGGEK
jgi:hypothetical protein